MFQTQGSNPGLPHCRWILYHLSHKGSPRILKWVSMPGDLPKPGIKPRSPTLQANSLPSEPQGKPKNTGVGSLSLLQALRWGCALPSPIAPGKAQTTSTQETWFDSWTRDRLATLVFSGFPGGSDGKEFACAFELWCWRRLLRAP